MRHERLRLDKIIVGDNFSREELGDLTSLRHSLEQHGLQQPVIISENWELIAGFRRYHAALELGWKEIDCVVTDQDPKLVNFIENLERKSLTFYEECVAVADLYGGCSDQEVADAVGRTISWSRPRNKLFTLPQEIIDLAKAGEVTPSKVTMILNAKNQQEVIAKISGSVNARSEGTIPTRQEALAGDDDCRLGTWVARRCANVPLCHRGHRRRILLGRGRQIMTPVEIIIAACLLAGPLFVGNLIGRIVSALYEARNDFLGRCEIEWINRFYIDSDYVLQNRQWIMRLFWTTVGAAVGGFAAGVFVERTLGLFHILSLTVPPC